MNLKKYFFPILLCFGIISAIQAGDFNSFYRTGLRKLRLKKYDEALVDFQKAYDKAELSKEEVRVLLIIANVYDQQKKYKDAKKRVLQILDIPDLTLKDKIAAYRRLIKYSVKLKKYDDALYEVRTALRIVSDNKDKAVFLVERAKIFEAQKKPQEALEALQNCIKVCETLSPQWQSAQKQSVIILYRQKEYKKVMELAPELQVDEWQKNSKQIVCYYIGLSAMKMEKYKAAAGWFQYMADKGHSWLVYSKNSQLGNCWKQLKEYDKAYKCFEAIHKNTEMQNYYRGNGLYMMAKMRYLQKRYSDSKKLCEKLKKFPKASKRQIKQADRLIGKMKK